eukprot:CAMPEP_0114560508 /NCGR_PEP_ID=MMETSP0114-20121206/11497_1 /TAXON_ID=31324 /ORGANISM="Goniomonas sp, Strain m" /LENGTH=133 /DNA_ID=CAMNT_0001746059 /DNA_START=742 /DNA_END=1142 /DNA_ORIENTATION=+
MAVGGTPKRTSGAAIPATLNIQALFYLADLERQTKIKQDSASPRSGHDVLRFDVAMESFDGRRRKEIESLQELLHHMIDYPNLETFLSVVVQHVAEGGTSHKRKYQTEPILVAERPKETGYIRAAVGVFFYVL